MLDAASVNHCLNFPDTPPTLISNDQQRDIAIGSFQPTEANGCQVMSSDFVDFCTVARYL